MNYENDLSGNFKNINLGNFSFIYIIIAVVLVVILVSSSFYTVQPDEVGMVLRLGRHLKNTPPGLHFKIPFGIDKVIPVRVEYIFKEEFGFRTQEAGVRTAYSKNQLENESLMLTGDLNILDISWVVQFRINNPYLAIFNIRDLRKTIRDVSEAVMRRVVGDYAFDEVITLKRIEVNNLVQEEMQKILNEYESGIQIITVMLQDVDPPDPVKPAFNEVNEAKQEREKMINQAWEVYNKQIPEARGQRLQIIEEAKGYETERINRAKGETNRFKLILNEYLQAQEVTMKRLYLENMETILKNAGKKYIVDPEVKGLLPLLRLENE